MRSNVQSDAYSHTRFSNFTIPVGPHRASIRIATHRLHNTQANSPQCGICKNSHSHRKDFQLYNFWGPKSFGNMYENHEIVKLEICLRRVAGYSFSPNSQLYNFMVFVRISTGFGPPEIVKLKILVWEYGFCQTMHLELCPRNI